MKKVLCFVMATLLALMLASCDGSHQNDDTTTAPPPPEETPTGNVIYDPTEPAPRRTFPEDPTYTGKISFFAPAPISGVYQRTVGSPFSKYFVETLASLAETGETTPALPRDGGEDSTPVKGTPDCISGFSRDYYWIQTELGLYRVYTPEKMLSAVDSYFGEGRILEVSEEFWKDLEDIQYHTTSDTWFGEYKDGVLTVSHTGKGNTQVAVRITSITFEEDNFRKPGQLTVELLSAVDTTKTVRLSLSIGDVIGLGDTQTVELKANVPQTVTLDFSFDWYSYWMYLSVDNTSITMKVGP